MLIRTILVIGFLFLFCQTSVGQSTDQKPQQQTEQAKRSQPSRPSPDEFVAVDEMPISIKQATPVYPESERTSGVEGTVWVKALVNTQGLIDTVIIAKGVEGHPEFSKSAIEAAKQSTFKPAVNNGKPVAVWITWAVKFQLSSADSTTNKK